MKNGSLRLVSFADLATLLMSKLATCGNECAHLLKPAFFPPPERLNKFLPDEIFLDSISETLRFPELQGARAIETHCCADIKSGHHRKVLWNWKHSGRTSRNADNRQNNDAISHIFIAQYRVNHMCVTHHCAAHAEERNDHHRAFTFMHAPTATWLEVVKSVRNSVRSTAILIRAIFAD